MCRTTAATFAVLACVACSEDHGHDHPDPAMLACDHVGEATTAVTAAATRDEGAPEIHFDGEPFTVTLPAGAAGYVRVVTDEPEHAGILLFDQADALSAIWAGGEMLPLTSAGADSFCPDDIPEHFDVDFEEPGTYFLELGPTVSGEVWMIAAESGEHGHMAHLE